MNWNFLNMLNGNTPLPTITFIVGSKEPDRDGKPSKAITNPEKIKFAGTNMQVPREGETCTVKLKRVKVLDVHHDFDNDEVEVWAHYHYP